MRKVHGSVDMDEPAWCLGWAFARVDVMREKVMSIVSVEAYGHTYIHTVGKMSVWGVEGGAAKFLIVNFEFGLGQYVITTRPQRHLTEKGISPIKLSFRGGNHI